MNTYKVTVKKTDEELKLPFGSNDTYYQNEEGKTCFDTIIVTTEVEYTVHAFNEEAINTLNSEFIQVINIELESEEDNWFDRLSTVQPQYLKITSEREFKASRKVIGEKQNLVREESETF